MKSRLNNRSSELITALALASVLFFAMPSLAQVNPTTATPIKPASAAAPGTNVDLSKQNAVGSTTTTEQILVGEKMTKKAKKKMKKGNTISPVTGLPAHTSTTATPTPTPTPTPSAAPAAADH